MSPGLLSQVLRQLKLPTSPDLLVGLDPADDAAVYRLTDELAVIATLDFFTPVVDDGYTWGQIAAANALSDVYAMGGRPLLALNIACFPDCLDPGIIADILRGGADKVAEAGAVIAGGHTVTDNEPKYGLSVVGVVSPRDLRTAAGARPGDVLVLTKPLGTGIIVSAMRGNAVSPEVFDRTLALMAELNAAGAAAMAGLDVGGCTDVTGFGLIGHGYELAEASGVSIRLDTACIPLIDGAYELAAMGIVPAGAHNNRAFYGDRVSGDIDPILRDVLYDPQTSGGLLISLAPGELPGLESALGERARVIGRVEEQGSSLVVLQ